MRFCYPCLSSGYVGIPQDEQTLNSRFYGDFEDEYPSKTSVFDDEIILFPQRIPRAGFFEEVCKVESSDFKKAFNEKTEKYSKNLTHSANAAVKLKDHNIRNYINWANLCLRYGLFDEVMQTAELISQKASHALEVSLLLESARIEHNLSNNISVDINGYLSLAKKYLSAEMVTNREKIMLLNNMIVTYYRHQDPKGDNSEIIKYAKQLFSLIENYPINTPACLLYCSVGYRGLAMVSEFDHSEQQLFLIKANTLAYLMPVKCMTPADAIVSLENMYTCAQSIAKWHEINQDYEQAEYNLNQMIIIDEYDSTSYSTLGFFFLKQKRYLSAAESFKKALELGPPGAGMNSYYYAKCLEQLGEHDKHLAYLLKAIKLDDKAVSPYIDLFEIYKRENDMTSAYMTAQNVINTPDLWEQLEDHEKKLLQSYAH